MKEIKNFESQTIAARQNKKERDYWLNKLSGEILKSCFPYDHEKGYISENRRKVVPFSIPEEISVGLLKISRDFDPNLYAIFTAAVVLLLNKYSGNNDILLGTPVLKQDIEADFINTVMVLRNTISGEMTFKELLLQVRQTTAEASLYQNYPIETLVYNLNLEFNPDNFALFDAVVLLENIHDRKYLEPIQPNVLFSFVRTPGGIKGQVAYNTLLYEKATIEQISNHLKNILHMVCQYPGIRLREIDLLSREERHRLLIDFNDNKANLPVDKSVYHIVEEHAARDPGRIALGSNDLALTYETLNARANKLARLLQEKGLQPDGRIGILLDRSPLMVLCILAAWKVGAAYIPIETNWPTQRIARVLKDSGSLALITRFPHVRQYPQPGKIFENHLLVLDQIEQEIQTKSQSNLDFTFPMNKISYIIYTSGSTGTPKGVIVEHKGMMNHMHIKITDLQLTRTSIVAQNASSCFDISVWQFFSALVVGGRTMIYPDECILDPGQFLSELSRDHVTILEVVPSYFSLLLDILDLDFKKSNCLKYLKYLLVTGEVVKPGLVKRWFEKYPKIKMVNAYGPTEASDDITHYIMDKAPETGAIPIGKPLQNLKIYVVDEHMKLCPIGVKGEIVVSGVGVGRGYLNDPGKTNQAFTNNPFVNGKGRGARIYKTSDLGCWLPNGNIAFFGRKDYQVKIRGHRIELEEIEKKLVDYPLIKEAVVIEKERFPEKSTGEPEKILCAFMVSREKINHAEVKEYLEEVLPGYMIPDIEQIDEMPITPNGKVDRKALAKLEISLDDETRAGAENKIQEKLLDIWSDVLGIDRQEFGIDSNFFHLGGHSIRATLLAARIHKEFNTRIQLKDIFEYPTIRRFSKLLKETEQEQFVAIEPEEKKEYYPLSSAQKRLFLVQRMDPEKTAYNLHRVFILVGALQKEKLEQIFKQLIARHESLRTSFEIIAEAPVQRIHPFDKVNFRMKYYQVTGEIKEHLRDFVHPFDLSQAPLIRVGLMKEKEDRHLLVVDMHHIITDGTSLEIIKNDFLVMYSQKEIPPLTIQYKDYSVWQNELQESPGMKRQEEYWMQQFEGEIPSLNLMTDSTREAVENFEGEFIDFLIKEGSSQRLKEFTNETGTTLYIVLLVVYMILLSKYTGQEDIIVGSGIVGRNHADLNNIIGMFINMLAMRNQPEKSKTFREFLEEVKKQTLDAFANQDYQFDELVNKLGLQRDWKRNPLFDTQFTFQNMEAEAVDVQVTDLAILHYEFQNKIMPFDLSLNGIELGERIGMSLGYVKAFFKHSFVEKMADHYIEILEQVLENRDIPLKDIKVSHEMVSGKTSFSRDEYTSGFEF